MSKLHQNCSTSILVVLVLFGTQLLLTQQSNTPTHFRHPQPTRLLDIVKCSGNPCQASRSLDDSDETFDLAINPNSNFTLEVQLDDQTEILVEFIFGEFANVTAQINLFTTKSSKGSIAVAADSDVDTIIPISTIKPNSPSNRLSIQIQNPYSSSIYIGVTVSEPDNSLAPWIVPVAVTGGILFVIVSISMIYVWLRKRRERRQLQWIYTGNFYGGSQPNQVAVDADKDVFSIERDLDKMFPEAKNQKFKSSFPQKTCTICLEDFQGEQVCRQLQCQHIFHTECVKLWLTSQAEKKLKVFCPNCHKEIVKKVEKKSKA